MEPQVEQLEQMIDENLRIGRAFESVARKYRTMIRVAKVFRAITAVAVGYTALQIIYNPTQPTFWVSGVTQIILFACLRFIVQTNTIEYENNSQQAEKCFEEAHGLQSFISSLEQNDEQ